MKLIRSLSLVLIFVGAVGLCWGLYMPAKALLSQILLRRAWDHSASVAVRPWPWARTWPVARLRVPRLGIDEIVLAGTEGAALAFAPGHADESAAPEEDGNIVIAGHRDTVFAFLSELRRGDNLVLETRSGRTRLFTVSETEIIDQNDTASLEPSSKSMLTLVTCYPFDAIRPGGPLRYIVRALLRSGSNERVRQGEWELCASKSQDKSEREGQIPLMTTPIPGPGKLRQNLDGLRKRKVRTKGQLQRPWAMLWVFAGNLKVKFNNRDLAHHPQKRMHASS